MALTLGLSAPAVGEPWVDWQPTQGFWAMRVIKVDGARAVGVRLSRAQLSDIARAAE